MTSQIPVHRCATDECPNKGQRTDRACKCHKTSEQVLLEQRDALLAALKHTVRWHDQLKPQDIAASEDVIARVEAQS